jgi:hypothetical protein
LEARKFYEFSTVAKAVENEVFSATKSKILLAVGFGTSQSKIVKASKTVENEVFSATKSKILLAVGFGTSQSKIVQVNNMGLYVSAELRIKLNKYLKLEKSHKMVHKHH